jgi:Protein of unknown function (DUF4230)
MTVAKTAFLTKGSTRSSIWRGRRRRLWVPVLAVVLALLLAPFLTSSLPAWLSPFHEQDVDHSPTPLLVQLQNVARFQAATGTFQVLVDVEHDTTNLPSVISGERTTLFAIGTVDASVDFAALGADRVTVSPDRRAVTVTLPAPTLDKAAIDPARSRIVGRERGLLQRVGDAISDNPVDDTELYTLAGQKLDAAARQSDLTARAEQSTRAMLTGLATSMGFTQVTVNFDAAAAR